VCLREKGSATGRQGRKRPRQGGGLGVGERSTSIGLTIGFFGLRVKGPYRYTLTLLTEKKKNQEMDKIPQITWRSSWIFSCIGKCFFSWDTCVVVR